MNQLPRRVLGAYFVAEGTGFAHHCYVQRRAKKAPCPEVAPVDEEYRRQFMSLARCQGEGSDPLACSRFVRHAFFGAPPEALPREAVHEWLQSHLGAACDDALAALEATLGQFASPRTCWGGSSSCFVYGQGTVEAWYKPLLFRSFIEAQWFLARRRLKQQGFQETRDPKIPDLSYWERCDGDVDEPPLLVLHGYGRGLASPLFDAMLPALGRRRIIIVDCGWLLVTRVPLKGDFTTVPTVRQIADAVAGRLKRQPMDILAHSFGTAVASALIQKLQAQDDGSVRRAVLLDPMCFIPGISKQAQLLRRTPRDLTTELLSEAVPGNSGFSMWEVLRNVVNRPDPCVSASLDEDRAAAERRKWIIYQTYFFNYFIFRDLVYSWVNNRVLFGPEYLDRGLLRELNRQKRLLTIVAETDTMIPSKQLRAELESEGSIMFLPTVGHGACQHREDVARRIQSFLG